MQVVVGTVACCWLVGLKRKEVRDLGCEGQYKKREEITISPVVQVLYAK